jgi:ABC-type transporter Mla MlaB component
VGTVRTAGLLDEPPGVERADHVCWAGDDDATFEEAAGRFLSEGLARGDRLMWIGDGAETRLRRAAGPLADVDGLTANGALEFRSVTDAYATSGSFSPEEQLAFYATATRRAIDEGYRGLRAVAEVTTLAGSPERRADFLRWEHLADDFVAQGRGLIVFCAYRPAELPEEVVTEAASLHPVVHTRGTPPPFRLWFDSGRIVLAGEVDTFGAARLERLLGATHVRTPVVTLDLARLHFIDLAGLRALARWARNLSGRAARLELVGAGRLFRRMWDLLGPAGMPEVSFSEAGP